MEFILPGRGTGRLEGRIALEEVLSASPSGMSIGAVRPARTSTVRAGHAARENVVIVDSPIQCLPGRDDMTLFDHSDTAGNCPVVGGATVWARRRRGSSRRRAEVVVMDAARSASRRENASIDLAERGSIDHRRQECGGRVDALFSCAGARMVRPASRGSTSSVTAT